MNSPTTHAALALRHPNPNPNPIPIPTLLCPLSSISVDDFQSNAWLNPCGLGISGLPDDHPLPLPAELPSYDDDHSLLHFASDFLGDEHPGPDDLPATDIIGLIPDVNMYDRFRPRDAGINPLDTICAAASLHDLGVSYGEPPSPTPMDHDCINMRPEQNPSPRVIQDIMSILAQPAPDLSFLPWPSANSPFPQSFSPAAPTSSTCIKFEPPLGPESEPQLLPAPCNFGYPNTTHPSPVLNAHLGVELDDLISKAERFRTKYPERDIDRAWLSHFAGKLSDRGELLNDFRCYVIGCDQRNKRRDHILVHVGAHIGQRPFACSVCPLRFLRKNECKRHEASHSGFRPYSCDICGQNFVRQDLVKRHVKRTHGLKDENQSGVTRRPRKKARLV